MICNENIHRITKYFLFSVLILFHLSFAQDEIELSLENEEGMSRTRPSRHLLYNSYSSSNMNGTELVVYIIAVVILTVLSICCKFCIKQGCEQTDDYSDAVVHAPPRRSQNRTFPVASGRRVLNPPRSSGSIILPPEEGVFTVDFTGIENPNYNPSIHTTAPRYHARVVPQFSPHEPSDENPTPLLDLPPSYESVMRDQNIQNNLALNSKIFDKPSK